MKSYWRSLKVLLCISLFAGVVEKSLGQDSTKVAEPTPADSCKQEETAQPLLFGLSADTSLSHGSAYGSFGDLLAEFPDAYHFDRGSVGQRAIGSLFGGTPNDLFVVYDGLILNDLLTGQADLNLIPVESVGRIEVVCSPQQREYDYLPMGHTVRITSRNMASLPIRSRVTYRTGNDGYDDVDARLGVQGSPKLAINAGGLLKNYAGTTSNSKYGAQKANVKIDRKFNKGWMGSYEFLLNKFDLDVPLPAQTLVEGFVLPHQKDIRYDHGFKLQHCSDFSTLLQYTDLHRELYGYRHAVVDQVRDASRFVLTTQVNHTFRSVKLSGGANWQSIRLRSSDWGSHEQWQFNTWTNLSGKIGQELDWHGGVQLEKAKGFGAFVTQELSLGFPLRKDAILLLWANRSIVLPSPEARFSNGPLALGKQSLKVESCQMVATGIERMGEHFHFYASATIQSVKNEIAIAELDSAEKKKLYSGNRPHQIRLGIDLQMEYTPCDLFRLVAKAGQRAFDSKNAGQYLTNTPKSFAAGYLQFSHSFFQGDLKVRLRLGASFYGRRYGTSLMYSQYSPAAISLDPVIVPYVHGIFVVKDVTLFVAVQNPLGQEYEIVSGYPMPKAQLRWGFSWNFMD